MDDRYRIMRLAAAPFGIIAAAILVFMMLFTTVTVVMREAFGTPVLGVVDVMEFALVGLIFLSMPGVFLRDENVTVDVIDQVVPRRVRNILRIIGLLLAIGWLGLMMPRMFPLMYDKWEFQEVTMTLGIPRYLQWLPIIAGFTLSLAGTAFVLVTYLRVGFPRDVTLGEGAAAAKDVVDAAGETGAGATTEAKSP